MYRIRLNNDHSKNESDRWYVNANFDIFRHFRLLLETVNHCVSDVRRAMDCLKVRHLCFYIYSPGVVCTLKSIRLEVDFNDAMRFCTSNKLNDYRVTSTSIPSGSFRQCLFKHCAYGPSIELHKRVLRSTRNAAYKGDRGLMHKGMRCNRGIDADTNLLTETH